jgi:hypothetical protein
MELYELENPIYHQRLTKAYLRLAAEAKKIKQGIRTERVEGTKIRKTRKPKPKPQQAEGTQLRLF